MPIFCMDAYECDVVVVVKWVPIFMQCMGAYYPAVTVLLALYNLMSNT